MSGPLTELQYIALDLRREAKRTRTVHGGSDFSPVDYEVLTGTPGDLVALAERLDALLPSLAPADAALDALAALLPADHDLVIRFPADPRTPGWGVEIRPRHGVGRVVGIARPALSAAIAWTAERLRQP